VYGIETKSLLPSLYKRKEIPSLAKRGYLPAGSRFGEGRGRFSSRECLLVYGLQVM
jgi:hypothetical protein